ncbi:Wadjet anti-phage system protein JetA family protein [Mesorhizobium australafricanum]|uniref:Wadjet anti-phage system protein JetA family protein n=1 Tax=Mesorhizobium australafricanum TaxID=3072311 RepID=UPI003D31838A
MSHSHVAWQSSCIACGWTAPSSAGRGKPWRQPSDPEGTGWLEEEEFGLRVTVDMPMGASLVMQLLSSLKSDVSQRFGGIVVNVK